MSSTSNVCNLILYNYTKVGGIITVINCGTKKSISNAHACVRKGAKYCVFINIKSVYFDCCGKGVAAHNASLFPFLCMYNCSCMHCDELLCIIVYSSTNGP